MSIYIKFYNPREEISDFTNFINEVYGYNSFLHNKDYVNWWFGSSQSHQNSGEVDILIARDEKRILGMNGYIATELEYKEKRYPFHWMANTIVHPDFRRGLGLKIINEGLSHFPYSGSISFKDISRKILNHLKYNMFGLKKMSRAIARGDTKAFNSLPNKNEILASIKWSERSNKYDGSNIIFLEKADMIKAALLWERVKYRYGLTTCRTARHLIWRYLSHPVGKYFFIGYGKQEIEAVCVFRIEGFPVKGLRIVDTWGLKDAIRPLISFLIAKATDEGVAFVDFFCTSTPDRSTFEDAGCVWLEEDSVGVIPLVMNPVTLRPYNEQIALKLPTELDDIHFDNTYFTRGDSDRDRPQ